MELLIWLNQHFQESKRIRQQCDYFNAKDCLLSFNLIKRGLLIGRPLALKGC